MEIELLTAEQLANSLGIKPRTVREWHRAGYIPATRLTPKVIRYDLGQVVATLKERQARKGAGRA
jgi:predicted site-specific integrase-resolvase